MRRFVMTVTAVVTLCLGITTGAHAASHKGDPSCSASPSSVSTYQTYTVSAIGLPTVSPDYLIVTRPDGTSYYYGGVGSPLGVNPDGTWSGTDMGTLAGTWTYTFSGALANSKYGTVATCTVQVN